MTTWNATEDAELAGALGDVVAYLEQRHVRGAVEAAREMRNSAQPGNGFRTASVPHAARPALIQALREVAEGHPLGGRLEAIAAGFDGEALIRAANGAI